MSDFESFSVRVGGAMTGEQLSHLIQMASWTDFEYIDEHVPLEDLERRISLTVYETPAETKYGVELWLVTNDMQYDLDCYSSGYYNGTTTMFRPATETKSLINVSFFTDAESEIIIRKSDLVDIVGRAMGREGPTERWESLLHQLDAAMGADVAELELPYITSGEVIGVPPS